jgi:hypothetical protein
MKELILEVYNDPIHDRFGDKYSFRSFHGCYQFIRECEHGTMVLVSRCSRRYENVEEVVYKEIIRVGKQGFLDWCEERIKDKVKIIGDITEYHQ